MTKLDEEDGATGRDPSERGGEDEDEEDSTTTAGSEQDDDESEEDSSEEDSQQNEFAKSAVINIEDSLLMEQLRSSASIKLGNLL